jgi:hypothetical protein
MLEQRGEKLFSCKLLSSLQSEMVRPVLFVDFMQNLRSGSSLLRSHQLWKLSKPGLDDTGTTSAVTASLDHRDSILVLNKNTLLHCSQEQVATLRQHGNVLMADPLDGKVDESILASCNVLLAASRTQFAAFQQHFPDKRTAYVGHHVDLRIGEITPPTDRLRLAYFGELVNAAFAGSLGDAVTFIHTDTSQAHDAEWIKKIHHFNAHYALRANLGIDGFKPFTKGFIASHCASPVLADMHDEEAHRFLPESYPYFADKSSMQSVIAATERMRTGFVGPEWREALDIMRQVKEVSSRAAVTAELHAALAPELSRGWRMAAFQKLHNIFRRKNPARDFNRARLLI